METRQASTQRGRAAVTEGAVPVPQIVRGGVRMSKLPAKLVDVGGEAGSSAHVRRSAGGICPLSAYNHYANTLTSGSPMQIAQ